METGVVSHRVLTIYGLPERPVADLSHPDSNLCGSLFGRRRGFKSSYFAKGQGRIRITALLPHLVSVSFNFLQWPPPRPSPSRRTLGTPSITFSVYSPILFVQRRHSQCRACNRRRSLRTEGCILHIRPNCLAVCAFFCSLKPSHLTESSELQAGRAPEV